MTQSVKVHFAGRGLQCELEAILRKVSEDVGRAPATSEGMGELSQELDVARRCFTSGALN